jgi:hypothetical protein
LRKAKEAQAERTIALKRAPEAFKELEKNQWSSSLLTL